MTCVFMCLKCTFNDNLKSNRNKSPTVDKIQEVNEIMRAENRLTRNIMGWENQFTDRELNCKLLKHTGIHKEMITAGENKTGADSWGTELSETRIDTTQGKWKL